QSCFETCGVAPPPGGIVAELSLPLTFFDIRWIHHHPVGSVLFYNHPCSKPYFLETLVPKLKESLSLTLKHYLPIAGNLLYPLITTEKKPVFRFISGDSVSLTIAESENDNFDELVTNHARDADQFYDFMPNMPPIKDETEYKILHVMAIQVTLFPGRGICVGFTNHHSLGDGSSIVGFMHAWASVNKLGESFLTEKGDSLPIFDRSVIQDPLGIDAIFWKSMREIPLKSSQSFALPTNRVRASYTLNQADIKRLKDFVLTKKPGLVQVSSFVITASYVWACLVKSEREKVDEEVMEYFVFSVDVRARMNPPVPFNYFGNCLGYGMARIERKWLVEEEGFVTAVEAIVEDIKNRVNDKDEVLKGAENWLSEMKELGEIRVLGVAGSPKFDLHDADFGWGRAKKVESLSIDVDKYSMSLYKSVEGGLEIGLSLPKERMEAFAAIFDDGLIKVSQMTTNVTC
ncbi:PREDICTED: malonyl-coenzyme:anthocyanin 5-O-glucoside-6'''-O-malonyltransferase-like, partial [Erythranthe guttata]